MRLYLLDGPVFGGRASPHKRGERSFPSRIQGVPQLLRDAHGSLAQRTFGLAARPLHHTTKRLQQQRFDAHRHACNGPPMQRSHLDSLEVLVREAHTLVGCPSHGTGLAPSPLVQRHHSGALKRLEPLREVLDLETLSLM